MARYNTGNPIDSNAMKDLSDNAQNLDVLANSKTVLSQTDRFGVERKTWHGIENDFSQWLLNSGLESTPLIYADGQSLQVLRPTQTIQRGVQLYRVRLPATFPVSLTGAWANDQEKLVMIADSLLIEQLLMPDGSSKVGDPLGTVRTAIRAAIFGGEFTEVLEWGSGNLTARSQVLQHNRTQYLYIGAALPKSLTGDFAQQAAGEWLRLKENVSTYAPAPTRLDDLTPLIRTGLNVVITGDSLSFNAYGFSGAGTLAPGDYAYKNPYGLASWGHLIRDSIYASAFDFTLAKNAQIEFTSGVSRYPNVNGTYVAPFNNQMETFVVNSTADEIIIRTNGVFSSSQIRLMFFTGDPASFNNLASFDVYTNGTLRTSVDLRGDTASYRGKYQLNVDGIPMAGASEIILRNIKRADGSAGSAVVQFIGYTSTQPNVYMTGHGGWTSGQVLADYTNMVGQYSPDIVFYIIGANDQATALDVSVAQFTANVEQFITQTRALKPNAQIVLLSTTPTDNYPNRYSRPGDYIDALYRLSVKYRCFFIDLYELFTGIDPAIWRIDNVHTTLRGGNLLYRKVMSTVFPTMRLAAGYIPDAAYQVVPAVTQPAARPKTVTVTFDAAGAPVVPDVVKRYVNVAVAEDGKITVVPVGAIRVTGASFVATPPSSLYLPSISNIGANGSLTYTVINLLNSPPALVTAQSQLATRTMVIEID